MVCTWFWRNATASDHDCDESDDVHAVDKRLYDEY